MFFLGKKSLPQWLECVLESQGVAFLISRMEGGGLLSQPTFRVFSVRATLQWMDLLLASLDCYTTFINLHLIKPHHMISKFECSANTSILSSNRVGILPVFCFNISKKSHSGDVRLCLLHRLNLR